MLRIVTRQSQILTLSVSELRAFKRLNTVSTRLKFSNRVVIWSFKIYAGLCKNLGKSALKSTQSDLFATSTKFSILEILKAKLPNRLSARPRDQKFPFLNLSYQSTLIIFVNLCYNVLNISVISLVEPFEVRIKSFLLQNPLASFIRC